MPKPKCYSSFSAVTLFEKYGVHLVEGVGMLVEKLKLNLQRKLAEVRLQPRSQVLSPMLVIWSLVLI